MPLGLGFVRHGVARRVWSVLGAHTYVQRTLAWVAMPASVTLSPRTSHVLCPERVSWVSLYGPQLSRLSAMQLLRMLRLIPHSGLVFVLGRALGSDALSCEAGRG